MPFPVACYAREKPPNKMNLNRTIATSTILITAVVLSACEQTETETAAVQAEAA